MKRMLVGVVACALMLTGCAKSPPQEIPVITPSPISAPSVSPAPPTEAELSAMAEATYRAAFKEWKRIEREGGADEASPVLLEHADGDYLNNVVGALRYQREEGLVIVGPLPSTRVAPAPGTSSKGSDPALTLRVCEDNTASVARINGQERLGSLVAGHVYLASSGGAFKVISSSTKEVAECGF